MPVTYTDVQGEQLSSNQYSVTEHFKHAYDGFPAVYIMYALLTAIPQLSHARHHAIMQTGRVCPCNSNSPPHTCHARL